MNRTKLERVILFLSSFGFLLCAIKLSVNKKDISLITSTNKKSESDIGIIKPIGNDVRLRGDHENSWSNLNGQTNLFEFDRVFTGTSSSAILNLDSKQAITISPDSLLVIRNSKNEINISLTKGSLFAVLKKGLKLTLHQDSIENVIESKEGESTISIKADEKKRTKFIVHSGKVGMKNQSIKKDEENALKNEEFNNQKPLLATNNQKPSKVDQSNEQNKTKTEANPIETSNEIEISENMEATVWQDTKLNNSKNTAVSNNKSTPNDSINPPRLEIKKTEGKLISPTLNSLIWDNYNITFKWSWGDEKNYLTEFEVAENSEFTKGVIKKQTNKNELQIHFLENGTFYWRIRNISDKNKALNNFSNISNFTLFNKLPPEIDQIKTFQVSLNEEGFLLEPINLIWKDLNFAEKYRVQISTSRDFSSTLLKEEVFRPLLKVEKIRPGNYYWKVESIHPGRDILVSRIGKLNITKKDEIQVSNSDLKVDQSNPKTAFKTNINSDSISNTSSLPSIANSKTINLDANLSKSEIPLTNKLSIDNGNNLTNMNFSPIPEANEDEGLLRKPYTPPISTNQTNQTNQKGNTEKINSKATSNSIVQNNELKIQTIDIPEPTTAIISIPNKNLNESNQSDLKKSNKRDLDNIDFKISKKDEPLKEDMKALAKNEKPLDHSSQLIRLEPIKRKPSSEIQKNTDYQFEQNKKQITILNNNDSVIGIPLINNTSASTNQPPPNDKTSIDLFPNFLRGILLPRWWINFGIGISYNYFRQITQGYHTGSLTSLDLPQWTFRSGGLFTENSGIDIIYKQIPGTIRNKTSGTLITESYLWKTLSFEYLSIQKNIHFLGKKGDEIYWRFGLQHHDFISVIPRTPNDLEFTILPTGITNLSLGSEYRLILNPKSRAEILLRYQHPFIGTVKTFGDEFSVAPKFSLDGSIGYVYKINNIYSLGSHWFGQFQYFDFKYLREKDMYKGSELFFNTSFDLNFGFEF